MAKSNFDLDMVDEYPDMTGSRNFSAERKQPEPMANIVPNAQKPANYESIPFSAFAKVDIRVGKILEVSDVPNARSPLYKLRVDLGGVGTRTLVAGIKSFYSIDQLIGRRIAVVVNLAPRSLAGIMSEGMLLAAEDDSGNVSLLGPDADVEPGCKIR